MIVTGRVRRIWLSDMEQPWMSVHTSMNEEMVVPAPNGMQLGDKIVIDVKREA
jgi:hypothetical protein